MNSPKEISFCAKLTFGAAAIGALTYALREAARRKRRIDFNGKTVLISGASRGLGLELARGFADEGADLILLARDLANLKQSADELRRYGVNVDTLAVDVSDEAQVRDALSSLFAKGRKVDVLVNNAGTIQVGPLEKMALEDYENALGVHFWGPLYLMREIVPHMQARGSGRIVNIASIGGKVAVPHLLPYAASKFALVGLSEGMRAELLKDGIYVTTVCPGLMRTGSHLNAYFKGQYKKEYALFAVANSSRLLSTASDSAAQKIIEACRYGQPELVITPQARLLRLVQSLFPNFTADMLGLVTQFLPKARTGEGDALRRGVDSRSPLAPSVLTRLADRAANRNNEIASAPEQLEMADDEDDYDAETVVMPICVCTHPTHFLGRCQNQVNSPEHVCAECMQRHFHRVDDPAI
jgi:short-subunit dehydrogenase